MRKHIMKYGVIWRRFYSLRKERGKRVTENKGVSDLLPRWREFIIYDRQSVGLGRREEEKLR